MNIMAKKKADKIEKQIEVSVDVVEKVNHFDYRSFLIHTGIFLALYLLMSVAENSDAIRTFIEANTSTEGAVIIIGVLSTFIKKCIDALIGYLSTKTNK